MGRWTQYDEDEYRLPEGMKRVGYDADSGKYYFRDQDGTLWEGEEGARFGEMKQVSEAPIVVSDDYEDDLEAAPSRADGYQSLAVDPDQPPRRSHGNGLGAYKMLFPFFLLIVVALLLVIRLVHYPSEPAVLCPDKSELSHIKKGDTCWKLSQARNSTLDELLDVNPGLDCDGLVPGQGVCLPTHK
ncbi:uncharacterized protein FIBRA_00049 [Fibroporia radiculosa]|uniref:LysM domain-containing protein n=1 Tax=Fibroporia radiculosa TaxID=599839 RepID=J7RUR0_9APHY|nr:uncharacterized protein FIBRA_00049 [Fibroporia radiculosa]CCL98055.1 predicted protein [Fibroporia radiculosa]